MSGDFCVTDEKGNTIDLDLVDAIGQLNDGRFDVWMADGTRTTTREPDAFATWQNHLRSNNPKSQGSCFGASMEREYAENVC